MKYTYGAEKYAGRVYCGNGFFNTIEECKDFAKDGFCDKVKITELATGKRETIKFEALEGGAGHGNI